MHPILCFPHFVPSLFLPPTTLLFVRLMPLCPCPKASWVGGGWVKTKGRTAGLALRPRPYPKGQRVNEFYVCQESTLLPMNNLCVMLKCSSRQKVFHSSFKEGWTPSISPRQDSVPEGLPQSITMVQALLWGLRSSCVPKSRSILSVGGQGRLA